MKILRKTIASIILTASFLNTGTVFADSLQGHAEKTDYTQTDNSELFTGKIDILDEKDVIQMTVSK